MQYNATKCAVGKFIYRAKGPFVITKDVGHNSFEMQRCDEPSSTKRKYTNTEFYVLPPALFPSASLDTINQRYIDSKYTPVVNPLMGPLKFELYNDKWLQSEKSPVTTTTHIMENLPN